MSQPSEKSIFLQALDIDSTDERERFLAEACAGNNVLRASVKKLLRAHETIDNCLDAPVAEWRPVAGDLLEDTLITETAISEDEGSVIGSYRLMEQIGEGGFGLVFVADQQKPVRRRVALKILKPGMDTREVVARFEAERQALAMMDHPNIAAVYDAGTTETGRPYFVMELVRGVAITEFCDRHELNMHHRLELFVTVCKAVHHAHQKGIIHRDIKPSNVLVTSHDGAPVVKVIDFGIAKAIGQRLTDKSIYTRFNAMMGTPLYMSPEQAEMSGIDIDTRSDIYSLGVLLYELLTGTTPFDSERINSAAYDEMRRIIREEEPPRPSERLTTLGKLASTVDSGPRRTNVTLPRLVRGDLDWIVMKAMEKDRQRRYDSASSLADDVRRYLNNDAIEARPPSQIYRLQKLARRHKVILITASLVTASLLLGTGISIWQATKAISERNEKEVARQDAVDAQIEATDAQNQIEEFAERLKQANILVTSGRAHAMAGRLSAAFADYSDAIEIQPNYYNAWLERASLQVQISLWKPAAADFARALKLGVPPENPATWGIAQLFLFTGDDDSYRACCKSIMDIASQNSENASIAAIRSYVMAREPFTNPVNLATQAEALLAAAINDPSHPQDSPDGGNDPPADERFGRFRPGAEDFGQPPPPPPDDRFGAPGFRGPDDRERDRNPGPPPHLRRLNHPRGAVMYITGLAHYRAGEFQKAIERFQEVLTDRSWVAREIVYPALAMAYHRNGQAEEAREAFASSAKAIDSRTDEMLSGSVGTLPFPWFDWIEFKLLHSEASVLLTGFTPAEDPRIRQIEARAQAAIRE